VSDFHLLLEEQLPKLMRYATALTRDDDEAGELIEDTVREALARQREWCGNADIRVWLLTLLHDLRGNPFRQLTLSRPAARDPAAELTLSALDHALGRLPEEQRALILLIGLEDLSYANTADILRISVPTLRSRLARARADLHRLMGVEEAPHLSHVAA
jgi:RNA polymerase sigma-70 factor (ECF subfamily)